MNTLGIAKCTPFPSGINPKMSVLLSHSNEVSMRSEQSTIAIAASCHSVSLLKTVPAQTLMVLVHLEMVPLGSKSLNRLLYSKKEANSSPSVLSGALSAPPLCSQFNFQVHISRLTQHISLPRRASFTISSSNFHLMYSIRKLTSFFSQRPTLGGRQVFLYN